MSDGWAPALAAGPGDVWVSADQHHLHVWSGETLVRTVDVTGRLGGPPSFRPDGAVLAGSFAIEPGTGAATELVTTSAVLTAYDPAGNAEQLAMRSVAWTGDGGAALVLAEYRPSRLRGAVDAAKPGSLLARVDGGSAVEPIDRGSFLDARVLVADRWLVCGGRSLRVFDAPSGTLVGSVSLEGAANALSTRGDLVVVGGTDGQVLTVLTTDSGAEENVERYPRHAAEVGAVAISPDSSLVASGDPNGDLGVWPVAGGEAVFRSTVPGRVDGLCFLAEDHLVVAVGGPNQELRHLRLDH